MGRSIYRVKNEPVSSHPAVDDRAYEFLERFEASEHSGLEIYICDEDELNEVVENLREGEDFALELTGWLEFLRQELKEHGECWFIIA